MFRRFFRPLSCAVVAATLLAVGCGGGDGEYFQSKKQQVTVKIAPSGTVLVKPGEIITLTANAKALRDKLTVKWDNLTIAQANSIDAFFQARYAVPFNWTPPQQSVQKLWRCTTWSVAYVERHASVSATLEEVFA